MKKYDRPTDSGWARLREAQLQAASEVSHTALAVTYDVGEWNDIHPLDKKSVAQRLFLRARKLIYREKVVCSGPIYKRYGGGWRPCRNLFLLRWGADWQAVEAA